jgi:hypothetical protein
MAYTVTTSTGYFSRIGNSLKGILIGFVLVIVSVVALWWNEGNALKTRQDLTAFQGLTNSVPSTNIDPANEGQAIHTYGEATTPSTLTDPLFEVSAQALKLSRSVEMYQWQENSKSETRKKLGGGEETVTTYTYDKTWSSSAINSSSFKDPNAPQNPGQIPFPDWEAYPQDASLDAFHLTTQVLAKIGGDQPLKPEALPAAAISGTDADPEAAEEGQDSQAPVIAPSSGTLDGRTIHLTHEGFYLGANPVSPDIGDVRITFKQIPPQTITVVGAQAGETISAWTSDRGRTYLEVARGTRTIDEIFSAAQNRNNLIMWAIRVGGFILMGIGFSLILKPLSVLADVLPFLGNLVGGVTGFVAFLAAASVSLAVIAIAWLFYRPVLAIALLVGAAAAIFFAFRALRKPRPLAAPAAP